MTEEIPADLLALAKTLEQQFAMHLNGGRSGHTYGYHIVEKATGRRVASKSKWSGRKGGKDQVRVVFTMGDAEFETPLAFLKAYQQRLRDEEFDAAAPKGKTA